MYKKMIMFLALVFVLVGTSSTYAQEEPMNINGKEKEISPLFTYITKHYVDIFKDNGKIKCETILSFTDKKATITNTLQEQTGYGWKDVSSESITYNTPGTKLFTSTFSNTSGTKYRCKSLVEIKDSGNKVLENSYVYSDYITY
jgi:hypothetical protein